MRKCATAAVAVVVLSAFVVASVSQARVFSTLGTMFSVPPSSQLARRIVTPSALPPACRPSYTARALQNANVTQDGRSGDPTEKSGRALPALHASHACKRALALPRHSCDKRAGSPRMRRSSSLAPFAFGSEPHEFLGFDSIKLLSRLHAQGPLATSLLAMTVVPPPSNYHCSRVHQASSG